MFRFIQSVEKPYEGGNSLFFLFCKTRGCQPFEAEKVLRNSLIRITLVHLLSECSTATFPNASELRISVNPNGCSLLRIMGVLTCRAVLGCWRMLAQCCNPSFTSGSKDLFQQMQTCLWSITHLRVCSLRGFSRIEKPRF